MRLLVCLVVSLLGSSYADNRVDTCDMIVNKLGLTFYTSAELQKIAKCCEPQMYKTPNNSTAIGQTVKTCVLNNSGNKALQALSLYNNANNCLNPESLDTVCMKLLTPIQKLGQGLINKMKSTLADCKKTNTQAAATKQETCIQKVYGIVKAGVTLTYVNDICTKLVKQNVTKQQWGCGQKYIPSVVTFSKYACSQIVKS